MTNFDRLFIFKVRGKNEPLWARSTTSEPHPTNGATQQRCGADFVQFYSEN